MNSNSRLDETTEQRAEEVIEHMLSNYVPEYSNSNSYLSHLCVATFTWFTLVRIL